MVGAVHIGTGSFRRGVQVNAEALAFLSDALVTLERRILAAGITLEYRALPASTGYGVAITLCTAPSRLGCRDAVILALGVFAEVDLDSAVLQWDPRLRIIGRFSLHGMIPLSPIR